MNDVFPINLYPSSKHGGVPKDFRENFLKVRKESLHAKDTWYAVTVSILSNTTVKYYVHDMLDNVFGGVGKQLYTIEEEVDTDIIEPYVRQRLYDMAEDEILKEEEEQRRQAIYKRSAKIAKRFGIDLRNT